MLKLYKLVITKEVFILAEDRDKAHDIAKKVPLHQFGSVTSICQNIDQSDSAKSLAYNSGKTK